MAVEIPKLTIPILLAFCTCFRHGETHVLYKKFLIISSPSDGKVGYVDVPLERNLGSLHVQDLVTTGLVHPQGIAVNPVMQVLFVADPDKGKILSYKLTVHKNGTLGASPINANVEGVESRWVAVDSRGALFFTIEGLDLIQEVPVNHNSFAMNTLRRKAYHMPQPKTLYDEHNYAMSPGGIATDGQNVYWTNKAQSETTVSVVKGSKIMNNLRASSVQALSNVSVMNFGLCIVHDNLFFTRNDNVIYGMKKTGGQVMAINTNLDRPRGCAWDGDGTLFVADRGTDAIYTLPANMQNMRSAAAQKFVNYEGAFGLAVLTVRAGASKLWPLTGCLLAFVTVLININLR